MISVDDVLVMIYRWFLVRYLRHMNWEALGAVSLHLP